MSNVTIKAKHSSHIAKWHLNSQQVQRQIILLNWLQKKLGTLDRKIFTVTQFHRKPYKEFLILGTYKTILDPIDYSCILYCLKLIDHVNLNSIDTIIYTHVRPISTTGKFYLYWHWRWELRSRFIECNCHFPVSLHHKSRLLEELSLRMKRQRRIFRYQTV